MTKQEILKKLKNIPCQVEEANKQRWHRQRKANEKNQFALEKLDKDGPEACDGEWCEIRTLILEAFSE